MNYLRIYKQLIDRAFSENRKKYKKSDERYVYYENHHIIPRCLGGTDEKSNLVLLFPEEHYIAHQLLVKLYPNNHKLLIALVKMSGKSSKNHPRKTNNKLYAWIRVRLSQSSMPEDHRNNIGAALKGRKKTLEHIENSVQSRIKNGNYRHTVESKENISVALSKLMWYNNGETSIRISNDPPTGYESGRLYFARTPKPKADKVRIGIVDKLKIISSTSSHGNVGNKNISWKGYIHTPNGIFESSMIAAKYYGVTDSTIRNRCRSNNKDFIEWVILETV